MTVTTIFKGTVISVTATFKSLLGIELRAFKEFINIEMKKKLFTIKKGSSNRET